MTRTFIVWTLSILSFTFPFAYADESSKTFYSKCIETDIQHCEVRARRSESRSSQIRKDAEMARKQAHYYEANREVLIEKMAQERIRTRDYKVHRYLLDAYYKSNPSL